MQPEQAPALARWLAGRLGAHDAVTDVTPLSTGFSAETVSFRFGDRRLILRLESPDPAVYPQQAPGHDVEVDIQYRVMAALAAGTSIPLAGLIGFEASPAVLGTPFFVMEYVDGDVPLVAPTYASAGFFADAPPAQRAQMIEDGLRRLAEIHTIDWEKQDLGWLLPPGEEPSALRQLRIWRSYTERELAGRRFDLLERAFGWLEEHAPPHHPADVTLNWGDPRIGNMIWRDHRCVCVTDFEAASIAPYLVDLGWWLMFDRWSHEHSGAPRLDGEPTREEQAALYFACSGRPPTDTHWYEVFAAARYCAIVVRVINRTVDRGLMPADNDYWRDNQATACLQDLLP
ncbi:MAG TPA: phosphotransferase family protein [Acidimicrobiales bacterium]|nr:phosphotransferase family protein [Acidimicrobiales bacterium]